MNKHLLGKRNRTGSHVGGMRIEHYFQGSQNFTKTVKDNAILGLNDSKRSDKVSLDNEYYTRLNDGLEQLFAHNGFEYFDIAPNFPLHRFWADGQVPTRYGGGFVEQVSAFRINFDLPQARLTGTLTNERQGGNVKEEKLTVPAYAFQYLATVTEYEKMKMSQISYDIYAYRVEAMRLAYQKELEYFRFLGNLGVSDIDENSAEFVPGLLNLGADVAENIFYGSDWATDFNVEKFLEVILTAIERVKDNTMGDESKYPNTMLVGSDIWKSITQPAVVGAVGTGSGTGVVTSIINYVQDQVEAVIGQPFLIQENFYLNKNATENTTTAGIVANGKNELGMIVIYRNDDEVMRAHIPMALTAGAMSYTAADGYQQNHIAIATPLLVIYPTVVYIHNGAE